MRQSVLCWNFLDPLKAVETEVQGVLFLPHLLSLGSVFPEHPAPVCATAAGHGGEGAAVRNLETLRSLIFILNERFLLNLIPALCV